jgi:acetyltransferase-like isoleucine patch superfamily enzyme
MPLTALRDALTTATSRRRFGPLVDAAPDLRLARGARLTTRGGLVIGSGVTIARGCLVEADGVIGSGTVLSRGVRVSGEGAVVLEGDNWVGAGATLVAPVTLQRGAVVAPGAVVTGHVPAGAIAAGDPGSVIGTRFGNDVLRQVEEDRALSA